MNGIKYYALDEDEEVPYEFVVIRNVDGEPVFCASFVNTNSLAYENGVLLRLHQRNDELRAENAKLRELVKSMYYDLRRQTFPPEWITEYGSDVLESLGIEVD